jgi:hypothetical protein
MTVKNTSWYLLAFLFLIFSILPHNRKALIDLVLGLCFLASALYGSKKSY